MFLAALISGENLTPELVETSAKVHLDRDDVGPVITLIELDTQVRCEGLSFDKFNELAAAAKEKGGISSLYATVEKELDSRLL